MARPGGSLLGLLAGGQEFLVFAVDAAQVVQGAEEGAVKGSDLGEDLLQEFGGGRIAKDGDIEVLGGGAFGEKGPVELGFGALQAAFFMRLARAAPIRQPASVGSSRRSPRWYLAASRSVAARAPFGAP